MSQWDRDKHTPQHNALSVFLSVHCEKHTLLQREQSITHQDCVIRSTKAGGQQRQTQAVVWTSGCCEHKVPQVFKIKAQQCHRGKHRHNQNVRGLWSSLQLHGNIWKTALTAPVNLTLRQKSLNTETTCISPRCKERASCLQRAEHRKPRQLRQPFTEV